MNSRDSDIARLRQALGSQNRHERAEAAIELGYRSDRDSLPDLQAMADDPDDLVAVSAMFACWQLGDDRLSMDRVVVRLASADEESVQLSVQVLCEMGAVAVPKLVELLDAGSPHSRHILRILGDIGGSDSLEAVRRTARSADHTLAEIARALLDDWDDE